MSNKFGNIKNMLDRIFAAILEDGQINNNNTSFWLYNNS